MKSSYSFNRVFIRHAKEKGAFKYLLKYDFMPNRKWCREVFTSIVYKVRYYGIIDTYVLIELKPTKLELARYSSDRNTLQDLGHVL